MKGKMVNNQERANDEIPGKGDYRHWGNVGRSVLNGVIGDYLVQQNNPLAIQMGFYHQRKPILRGDTSSSLAGRSRQRVKFSYLNPHSVYTNKVVVLLHGLTNLETIWDFSTPETERSECDTLDTDLTSTPDPDNYGARLQRDFGYTPFYLRYNTGLPIEENGRQFAALMDKLDSVYPMPIDEIVLVGFSMGGLLMRHAQKTATETDLAWLSKLTHCFYLGTPHEGSPLEKFGHLASSMVRSIPRDYVNQWADWIDVRSEGIQDLKNGLTHLNRSGMDDTGSATSESDNPCNSFYPEAMHHFVSGSLSADSNSTLNKMFGDSLVRQPSACPESAPDGSRSSHFEGIPHVPLAHSERVYKQITRWIDDNPSPGRLCVCDASTLAAIGRQALPRLQEAGGQEPSQREMAAGALDLLSSGYAKTVEAVASMHLSVSQESFDILRSIPLTKPVSEIVETAHQGVTESVYHSVKQGEKLLKGISTLLGRSAK